MKKDMKNREKIVEELKTLRKKGFNINVGSGGSGVLMNSAGVVSYVHNTNVAGGSLQALKSNMNINIAHNDTESDILDKIGDAKELLGRYESLIDHKRKSPDLMEYIIFNLED